jgi:hypothetical protein
MVLSSDICGKAGFQRAPGGAAAGLVAVEAEDDVVGLAQQLLHVGAGAGRAERRHRLREAELGQGDDVHIAFGHQHVAGVADRLARLEQAVQLLALVEQRGFRRVQVFRFAAIHHAAAKADHLALGVPDREHDALAEAVVAFLVAAVLVHLVDDEAGLDQRQRFVVLEHGAQVVPAGGRIAHAEARRHFAGQAAALQVGDRVRRLAQLGAVEVAGLVQRVGHRQRLRLLGGALGRRDLVVLFRDDHADALRQVLDRIDEAHARVFDQEADGSAVRAAAEAVVELLGRAHREAGRLFIVKRAQAHVVGAALFELDVAANHIDDVDAVEQIGNE